MEKYRTIILIEKIRKCLEEGNSQEALKIVESIDKKKLKNMSDLSVVAECYFQNSEYYEAKVLFSRIYQKNPSRRIVAQLVHLSIKLNDLEEAKRYLTEFKQIAPDDFYQYIFRYSIDKLAKAPLAKLIEDLVHLKNAEYIESWAYELAKLYHKSGMAEECVAECDNIVLWFGNGEFVERAKALRAYYRGEIKIEDATSEEGLEDANVKASLKEANIEERVDDIEAGSENLEEGSKNLETDSEYLETSFENIEAELEEKNVETLNIGSVNVEEINVESINLEEINVESVNIETINVESANVEMINVESLNVESINIESLKREASVNDCQERQEEENQESLVDTSKENTMQNSDILKVIEAKNHVSEDQGIDWYQTTKASQAIIEEAAQMDSPEDDQDTTNQEEEVDFESLESALARQLELSFSDDGNEEASVIKAKALEDKEIDKAFEAEEKDQDIDEGSNSPEQSSKYQEKVNFELLANEQLLGEEEEDLLIELTRYQVSLSDIFGNFMRIEEVRKQLILSMDQILTQKAKFIILTGEPQSGKTHVAKRFAKLLYRMKQVNSAKIALVDGEKLNRANLMSKKEQLKDCVVVIEQASLMSKETVKSLLELCSLYHNNIAIILEDTREKMNQLLRSNTQLTSTFNNRVHLPMYRVEHYMGFAYDYISEHDYEIEMDAYTELQKEISAFVQNKRENAFQAIFSYLDTIILKSEKRSTEQLKELSQTGRFSDTELMVLKKEDINA